MTIAVFGATGKTGLPLIRQSLRRGHRVRALVRSREKFNNRLPDVAAQVEVIEGDVTNRRDVDRTVQGTEAIISVIGPTKSSSETVQQTAGRNFVGAAEEAGIGRLIILTGAGVRYPKDRPKFMDHFIRFLLRVLNGKILRDSIAYADTVMKSGLDWTVVRGPMLTEEPGDGSYRVGYAGVDTGVRCSRENLAAFILDELERGKYIRDAPVVSDT